jgi:thioredoxin-dependent peroxiredoxin
MGEIASFQHALYYYRAIVTGDTMPKTAKPPKNPAAAKSSLNHPLEGKKAPAFELMDATGQPVKLKDLKANGAVVLYFYPKDMTPGCTTEACSFRDNLADVRKAGAEIVGVSGDSSASHHKFIAKYGLNFPLLADPDHKVSNAYGVYKMKSLYGRQYMGIERTTIIIDRHGIIRKVFPMVKVNGHTEQALTALKDL